MITDTLNASYPKKQTIGETIKLSSKILTSETGFPDELYFSVPKKYESFLSDSEDWLASALLFPAMATKKDLLVDGSVSERFLYGAKEYQKYFKFWRPSDFETINISANPYADQGNSLEINQRAASFFSGGVDSFYTLHSHLPHNEPLPPFQIQYCFFLHGFDIPLSEEFVFNRLSAKYADLLGHMGVEMIPIRTNLRHFLDPKCDWLMVHGAFLSTIALLMSRGIRRVFIGSTNRYSLIVPPLGSNPMTDHLLSRPHLEVFHHGSNLSRIEKLRVISQWEVTYQSLRVCWENTSQDNNCGRCAKCLRTMLALETLGSLKKYRTFPVPLDLSKIPPSTYYFGPRKGLSETSFAEELLSVAQAIGNSRVTKTLSTVVFKEKFIPYRLVACIRAGFALWGKTLCHLSRRWQQAKT